MKIALIGHGKMGRAIEAAALTRGHEITLIVTSKNPDDLTPGKLRAADVAIEFTNPGAAWENVRHCIEAGLPVVSGTTGWNAGVAELSQKVNGSAALLHTSNFSIGVNIFFEINRRLAALMADRKEYSVNVTETHHTQKKDAPSGTAISLANDILMKQEHKKKWLLNNVNEPEAIPIFAHRVDDTPGTHAVRYHSRIDDIEIVHTAHNREGFVQGAILAAEFLCGKQGVFTMQDVLGL